MFALITLKSTLKKNHVLNHVSRLFVEIVNRQMFLHRAVIQLSLQASFISHNFQSAVAFCVNDDICKHYAISLSLIFVFINAHFITLGIKQDTKLKENKGEELYWKTFSYLNTPT